MPIVIAAWLLPQNDTDTSFWCDKCVIITLCVNCVGSCFSLQCWWCSFTMKMLMNWWPWQPRHHLYILSSPGWSDNMTMQTGATNVPFTHEVLTLDVCHGHQGIRASAATGMAAANALVPGNIKDTLQSPYTDLAPHECLARWHFKNINEF